MIDYPLKTGYFGKIKKSWKKGSDYGIAWLCFRAFGLNTERGDFAGFSEFDGGLYRFGKGCHIGD